MNANKDVSLCFSQQEQICIKMHNSYLFMYVYKEKNLQIINGKNY